VREDALEELLVLARVGHRRLSSRWTRPERLAQAAQAAVEVRARGVGRDREARADLVEGELLEATQAQHVGLARREPLERHVQVLELEVAGGRRRVGRREIALAGQRDALEALLLAQHVHELEIAERVGPRVQRGQPRERRQFGPDADERLLRQVVEIRVGERAAEAPVQRAHHGGNEGHAARERLERARLPGERTARQGQVGMNGRGHAPRSARVSRPGTGSATGAGPRTETVVRRNDPDRSRRRDRRSAPSRA
jgi:hypothetical protein